VVTFQDGLIDILGKHARKGRLVYIDGKLRHRRWRKKGEDYRATIWVRAARQSG
jgi:single-stranded DNA-binding protein